MNLQMDKLPSSKVPRLVMIPGWSMPGAIFAPLLNAMPNQDVQVLELPGYASSCEAEKGVWRTEKALINCLLEQLPDEPVVLVGWSLGGLLSLLMAHVAPGHIIGVVLLASNPIFVAKDEWPGLSEELFTEFSAGVDQNRALTLRRFQQLCCMGSPDGRALTKWLRSLSSYEADGDALHDSLQWLAKSFRGQMESLEVPLISLLASDDALVPARIAAVLPGQVEIIPGSSHLLFADKPQQVASSIINFVSMFRDVIDD